MEIDDAFSNQLKVAEPLTKEDFEEESFKTKYSSGRSKKVGDIVLLAWMVNYDEESDENNYEIVSLHPDELSEYKIDHSINIGGPIMPTIKKIGK